ncbi:MAG: CRISPR-associated endonuclease Cas2 [Lachnospirales bacterium]
MGSFVYDSDFYDLPSGYSQRSMSYLVLLIYDVVDNKQRTKLSKVLEGYGKRVQKSAFECVISANQLKELVTRCLVHIDNSTDSLRVYKLSGSAEINTYGTDVKIYNEAVLIV